MSDSPTIVSSLDKLAALGSGSGSQYLYAPNLANLLDAGNVFSGYVKNEQDLLDSQSSLVSDATLAKSRQIALNESQRKRTQDYSYMMFVVCILLGVLLLLAAVKPMLTFIPSIVFDLLIIVIVAFLVIYVIYVVGKIQARDKMNYDTLNLPSPEISPSDAAAAAAASAAAAKGNLLDASKIEDCAGSGCCFTGTTYDATTKKCIRVQGMTTMTDGGNAVLPYTPTETTQYAFLH